MEKYPVLSSMRDNAVHASANAVNIHDRQAAGVARGGDALLDDGRERLADDKSQH